MFGLKLLKVINIKIRIWNRIENIVVYHMINAAIYKIDIL